jgi:CxxC motif-containing protein (DUF1111 family)
MRSTSLARSRRLVGALMLLLGITGVLWFFSPGLPVFWGPYASAADRAAGQELFEHEWQPNDSLAGGDGLGPVFNAKSCVACHFQGGVGGGGSNQHNVVTYEVLPTAREPQLRHGVLHAYATDPTYKETQAELRKRYPIIKGETRQSGDPHCRYTIQIPDFDPLLVQNVNTTALFGVGWIDRISPKAIRANWMSRAVSGALKEFELKFESVPSGRPRVLPDGRIGKFGWKAQFATLQEFVAAACANELGLGNPMMEQAAPLGKDGYAGSAPDMSKKQFNQLLAFVDTLPRPVEAVPAEPALKARADRGKEVFTGVGCALCHVPDLGGVKGVYSDFLLHSIETPPPGGPGGGSYQEPQPQQLPLPEDHPRPREWKTPPLWGVADSAPYFHDGGSPTLLQAILRHSGGASAVTEAFKKLSKQDQDAMLAFLGTLKAPPDAAPAPGKVARR